VSLIVATSVLGLAFFADQVGAILSTIAERIHE
jgi:hypothetical protein